MTLLLGSIMLFSVSYIYKPTGLDPTIFFSIYFFEFVEIAPSRLNEHPRPFLLSNIPQTARVATLDTYDS
jgi:hypothetical protein